MPTPCIDIPSPQKIHELLFTSANPTPPAFPTVWNAPVLLTPFGGLDSQLVVGNVTYDVSTANSLMRFRLYQLESLQFYDFLFVGDKWYWLVTDPAQPNADPTAAYGPFSTGVTVPPADFLKQQSFSCQGTFNVVAASCDGFAAKGGGGRAGTWYWYNNRTSSLWRIMNVDDGNDFKLPVLGAYYFVNAPTFSKLPSSNLPATLAWCQKNAQAASPPSPMITLADIQTAMSNPPSGSQVSCTLAEIQALIPGISAPPRGSVTPPAWTDGVESQCYMVGQDTYPYYCHVWYDWDYGAQLSVFVTQGGPGDYDERQDELLPKGKVGPGVNYDWDAPQWTPVQVIPGGGVVPQPVPDFVKAGGGICRAVIEGNPNFGGQVVTIWSIAMGNAAFWDWFDEKQRGIVFSLAPASSLTLIDYQTFEQNPTIEHCVFDEPSETDVDEPTERARRQLGFLPRE